MAKALERARSEKVRWGVGWFPARRWGRAEAVQPRPREQARGAAGLD